MTNTLLYILDKTFILAGAFLILFIATIVIHVYQFRHGMAQSSGATAIDDELTEVLYAIRVVESNNNPDAVGDSGNAIGVYQIWNNYWIDATQYSGIGGEYKDCYDADYADKIVRAYMKRYATEKRIGRKVTQEDIARMHNGGPNALKASGKKKENLDIYWSKVQKELNR